MTHTNKLINILLSSSLTDRVDFEGIEMQHKQWQLHYSVYKTSSIVGLNLVSSTSSICPLPVKSQSLIRFLSIANNLFANVTDKVFYHLTLDK